MARNEEKAQNLLNRWVAGKREELNPTKVRPYLASECQDLTDAENFRREIIREFSQGLSKIQNAGLGEYRLRDLNDELNKLLREKRHWEFRIAQLGGPDYTKIGHKFLDNEGKTVIGNYGYKYFGAARELPGVRELLQPQAVSQPKRTRGDLYKYVDADYYGYRDDDDGVLKKLEAVAEARVMEAAKARWTEQRRVEEFEKSDQATAMEEEADEEGLAATAAKLEQERKDRELAEASNLIVPSQKEIEQLLLKRRKEMLLKQYASDALMADVEATTKLTGRS
eukprot:TRINITY_DN6266_c0_g1_i4.p1 TRINITY_DN6266_c0_g1~~TRINITY_DN6266_c0_g1_i4.p1  ORF type:complete len:282 (+),score=66.23 TRINITY_DN6266_c0_g1_i4:96-941(+)